MTNDMLMIVSECIVVSNSSKGLMTLQQHWELGSELPSLHALSLLVRLTAESELPDAVVLLTMRVRDHVALIHSSVIS